MIRPITDADRQAVVDIWLHASFEAHAFIPCSYWENKAEEMETVYLPSSETWVYEDESSGEVCGFLSLVDSYLAALFVLPEKQGAGVGSRLMQKAKSMRSRLCLHVYAENAGAVSFYKKQCFQIIGEQADQETGRREYRMEFLP